MSFRGLSLAEAWRFGRGPVKFTIALILKLIAFKGPRQWLPADDCESPCAEEELSTGARDHLLPTVVKARSLGYVLGQFRVLTRNLDSHTKEAFAYTALHEDKIRSIFIGYVSSDASGFLRPTVAVTGSLASEAHEDIEFMNHPNFMDGAGSAIKIRVAGRGLEDLDAAMQDYVRQSRSVMRQFSSFAAQQEHARAMNQKAFEARIARGLYVYEGAG